VFASVGLNRRKRETLPANPGRYSPIVHRETVQFRTDVTDCDNWDLAFRSLADPVLG